MKTYVEQIEEWYDQIGINLAEFISTIKIDVFTNDPNSNLHIFTHPNRYDTSITDEQKIKQIQLKREFSHWKEHFLLFAVHAPKDLRQQIEKSVLYIENQIDLVSNSQTQRTPDKNAAKILEYNEHIKEILSLFKGRKTIVLVPDTNSLILVPDLQNYKNLVNDTFELLLLPTVLSELDKLKIIHRDEEFRRKVNSVIKRIKGYRSQGSLHSGVTVDRTIIVKMIAKEPNFSSTLSWLDNNNNDDKIIASLIEYQVNNPSHCVYLVTSDINLQNKAEMARLPFFEPPIP